ncbi:MAG: KpsF/GutQ family sugar-phosphate isomerase [Pseudomonadota bacterium]
MTDDILLAHGREVLAIEIEGLQALSDGLGESFVAAVRLMASAKGRIIVTGMGKSGHVGRKIAATLASTGRPASFVHPGEASHGDLGMITQDDVVLALSKSGETPELRDVVGFTGRFSIPLIAMTYGAASALADAGDVKLILPDTPEACAETRAPTTSTTAMMALGDALAVALLREAGFTATDFRTFHPGGKLGAVLRKAKDLMHVGSEMPLVSEETGVVEAAAIMSAKGFGCVGVVDDQARLAGILTDGDLRRHIADDLTGKAISVVMTRSPVTVAPETPASEALALLSEKKISAVFVVEDARPVGVVHLHDFLAIGVL